MLVLAAATSALLALAGQASANTYKPTTGTQLQQAISDANANTCGAVCTSAPGTNQIVLSNVDYIPTLPMTITQNVIITGSHAAQYPGAPKISGAFIVPFASDTFTINNGATAVFKAMTITNSSDVGGFAVMHVKSGGHLETDNMALSGNGGIAVLTDIGGAAVLNSTDVDGQSNAGIQDNGSVALNNVTLADNAAGAIDATSGTLTGKNTIISNNTPGNCAAPVNGTLSNSIDSDGSCGGGMTVADPLLSVTGANGGPSASKVPGAGSPAIGAGANCVGPTVDQRYFVRGPGCDIGSVQRNATRQTTGPSCVVTGVRRPPAVTRSQQDVTAQDGLSGLDSIGNIVITNGTVSVPTFVSPLTTALVLTATKTTEGISTKWSFDATNLAGITTHCS